MESDWHTGHRSTPGIAFLGSDSTGKTTLIRKLQDSFSDRINFISEIARPVILSGYPLGKDASADSYVELSRRYLDRIYQCKSAEAPFISDRTMLDPFCYALVNATIPRPQVRPGFIEFLKSQWLIDSMNYSVYFYFPIEFPISNDGVRVPDEEYRQKVDNTMQELIYASGKKVVHISGSPDERAKQAIKIVSQYVD